MKTKQSLQALVVLVALRQAVSFSLQAASTPREIHRESRTLLYTSMNSDASSSFPFSRRSLLQSAVGASFLSATSLSPALAATRPPLEDLLYNILRVREATQQESRLISSGKFKDVQRANVKLAVKFMLENYRLADQFVQASTYIADASKRLEATQVGQTAVQNLYTILEYFDSSNVENIKVGQNSMSGKEAIVLKGLDATRQSIDSFIGFFPTAKVDEQKQRITEENSLNIKEFDPSLGSIVNLPNP